MIRIAILDLYEGQTNQGMRCLRQTIREWSLAHNEVVEVDEFEVRIKHEVPDLSYQIYISSGGPGSPVDSIGSGWESAYFGWLQSVEDWNSASNYEHKKHIFLICHSFEIVCREYGLAIVNRRKSNSFGVFPVHLTEASKKESVFTGLQDPFYVVDSRDWQVVQPNDKKIEDLGAEILCIEKERPHVPYERAIMAIRFNEYMIGTQFHPEADPGGMSMLLQTEEKKKSVIENHGLEKWQSMIDGLKDPHKISSTYNHILPNFLNLAVQQWNKQLLNQA